MRCLYAIRTMRQTKKKKIKLTGSHRHVFIANKNNPDTGMQNDKKKKALCFCFTSSCVIWSAHFCMFVCDFTSPENFVRFSLTDYLLWYIIFMWCFLFIFYIQCYRSSTIVIFRLKFFTVSFLYLSFDTFETRERDMSATLFVSRAFERKTTWQTAKKLYLSNDFSWIQRNHFSLEIHFQCTLIWFTITIKINSMIKAPKINRPIYIDGTLNGRLANKIANFISFSIACHLFSIFFQ